MPSSFNYSPTPTAGSVTATASGKLSDGSKVILNSDGTVSVVAATGSSTLLSTNKAAGTGSVRGDRRCVIGVYDSVNDVFYPPKPIYSSWVISGPSWEWQPPVPKPQSDTVKYKWNESTISWIEKTGV